jgi:ABC-2 type transport system ATP-binding protein
LLCQTKESLLSDYGVVQHLTDDVPAEAILCKKETPIGVSALVRRCELPLTVEVSPVSIEDVFLYMVKEVR